MLKPYTLRHNLVAIANQTTPTLSFVYCELYFISEARPYTNRSGRCRASYTALSEGAARADFNVDSTVKPSFTLLLYFIK